MGQEANQVVVAPVVEMLNWVHDQLWSAGDPEFQKDGLCSD
jgi:hypothetical protein